MANILIVDDEVNIRETFKIFLTRENHNVFLAEDAEKAFDIIDSNELSLIITDIIMPKVTGMDMFEKVRLMQPDLPIIIMTGEPTISTAKNAVKGGASDYLIKPVGKDILLKTVANALSKKELQDKNKEYRENLERLLVERTEALDSANRVMELSPTPTIIIDLEDNSIFNINKAMLDFMKINSIEHVDAYFPFESQEYFNYIKTLYYTKGKLDNIESRIKRQGTNESIWCLISANPIKMAGMDLTIVSFTYLNELIETQVQLRIARQKAEEAAKAKSEFLANMSHEIRTPMNAIIGLSELLNSTNPTEKQKSYINKLNISAKNLLNIINDILDFSRLESSKLSIEHTSFNVNEILENIETIMYFNAQKKNLDFIVSIDEDIPNKLMGDPLRLSQVLLNFANNAVKFTEQGEVLLKVERISENRNSIGLKFSVKDTGIGISESEKEKLFTAFTQADASITRKYGGSGLGLAICKGIVDLMDGEIGFVSEIGRGSTFFFTVDLDKQIPEGGSEEEEDQNKKIDDKESMKKAGKSKKILIVEDNQINQLVTEEMLKNLGCTSEIADNGKEAIDKIANNQYDLVLMDLQMPVMDGYTATRKIREQNTDIPIIALSGETRENFKNKIYEAGMNDYLAKPINIEDLKNTIKDFL